MWAIRLESPFIAFSGLPPSSSEPDASSMSLVGNVFFNDEFCSFLPNYVEPQLLSSHTNLGSLAGQPCTTATREL